MITILDLRRASFDRKARRARRANLLIITSDLRGAPLLKKRRGNLLIESLGNELEIASSLNNYDMAPRKSYEFFVMI